MNQYSRHNNNGNYRQNSGGHGSQNGNAGVENGYFQPNTNSYQTSNPNYRRKNQNGNYHQNYQKHQNNIPINQHQTQFHQNNRSINHNNHYINNQTGTNHQNHAGNHNNNPNGYHNQPQNHHTSNHQSYVPAPVPQQYNKPDPNFREMNGAAFFIGQLDKTVNRDTVYNEIIRHSKQAAKGQGFYVRRMCMPTANSSNGTGNCGFAIVHTRSCDEANYVLRLGKLRIAGKDCQVQPYADRRSKKDSGNSKTEATQEGVSTGSSSAPISPKAGSNDDSGANSSYSSSSSLKQEKSVKIEDESPSRTESAEADKTSLPASKNDIDSVSVVTTAASIANQVTTTPPVFYPQQHNNVMPYVNNMTAPVPTHETSAAVAMRAANYAQAPGYQDLLKQWTDYYMHIGNNMGYDNFYQVYSQWYTNLFQHDPSIQQVNMVPMSQVGVPAQVQTLPVSHVPVIPLHHQIPATGLHYSRAQTAINSSPVPSQASESNSSTSGSDKAPHHSGHNLLGAPIIAPTVGYPHFYPVAHQGQPTTQHFMPVSNLNQFIPVTTPASIPSTVSNVRPLCV